MGAGPLTATAEDYARIFDQERAREYPVMDALEARLGYAVDRERLERAARVLACPLKVNPPNWQHGRLIYAVARAYLEAHFRALHERGAERAPVLLLDIGTAKGFSALCLRWAIEDSGYPGEVVSVDVIDPRACVRRNTVAEIAGPLTLHEILAPWPEASSIRFERISGRQWLTANGRRVHLTYVDGKHTYDEVSWEAALLAYRQEAGDVIVFDDLQIPGVARAVDELRGYEIEHVVLMPERRYVIARKQEGGA